MRYLLMALVLLFVAGCVSYVEVPRDEISTALEEGDYIKVVTNTGGEGEYIVDAVESDALIVIPIVDAKHGVSERMPLTDIEFLEKRRGDQGGSSLVLAGGIVLILILILAAGASAGVGAI